MNRLIQYQIDETDILIKDYLKRRDYSRRILIELKAAADGILVNGIRQNLSCRLKSGDLLQIHISETESSSQILPVDGGCVGFIVYEDEDILVINKPADTPIHPSQGNYDNTLANFIVFYYKEKDIPFVFRCITRLDRDTTGLLVIAKHKLSAAVLSKDMLENRIQREYLAVAEGLLPESGTITAPIAREADSIITRTVDAENGAYARTHFKRLFTDGSFSLAALKLDTGRTHQIRVHLKHIGHPLPGDYLYHPDYSKIKRQALHSHRLSFYHPIHREHLTFSAPLPEDMHRIFQSEPTLPSVYSDVL